ncbi:glycoside hydrolase family 27 protein [Gandjariella thermophila]|uniref:glycoside hydrolase family 27 protein n=1 Tax=Gandjariella thermophila TaxID=1931992 RepID=UPI001CEF6FC9|nr:glycoside hydrolase family 27 protein [Gandjariella thermophila]
MATAVLTGRLLLVAVLLLVLAGAAAAVPQGPDDSPAAMGRDGLAATPPMGWNSWNAFGCDIDEAKIRGVADALVASGMRDAGYRYLVVDDCWFDPRRGPDGQLRAAPDRFPGGIPALVRYVHERGLRFGIYLSPATRTCAQYAGDYPGATGSRGHEVQDAGTIAAWGADYLKYDWCSPSGDLGDLVAGFRLMRDALRATGRPIVYSINANSHQDANPGETHDWSGLANLSRTTQDITAAWHTGLRGAGCLGISDIIEVNAALAARAGPGHWNDPDMLEIGVPGTEGLPGLTPAEARTHLGMWAMMAAPLIAGNDVRSMDAATRDLLTNRDVIAVDQDRLGRQGRRIRGTDVQVWVRPLVEGVAVAVYNRGDATADMAATTAEVGLPPARGYLVRDAWSGRQWTSTGALTAAVGAHDTALLVVRPLP